MIDKKEADEYNERHRGEATAADITELAVLAQEKCGLPVDGKLGTVTRAALAKLRTPAPVIITPPAPVIVAPPASDRRLPARPKSYAEAARAFRVPTEHFAGSGESEEWKKLSIVECHGDAGRYPGLRGNLKFYFKIHRVVEPHWRAAWEQALITSPWAKALADADPLEGLRAGGYVYRTIRHVVGGKLSPHGIGVAGDIRPDLNPGKDVRRGDAPEAFSPAWYAMFPGSMDQPFVEAFRDHGFTWGADWDEDGDTEDEVWLDLMHFEWIDRTGGGGFRSDGD